MISKPTSPSKGKQVIAVVGSMGAGKSSFIHNAMPPGSSTGIKVGHSLKSETRSVQLVCWDAEDGTRIELVDTPGFDVSRKGVTDVQVRKMIVTSLTERHGKNSRLTGLIYIHRISDTRVGMTSQCGLQTFCKLCGLDSLKNVVIVTTMWDQVTAEEGSRHEQELMSSNDLFKPLMDGGATMMRHGRTAESATKAIDYLLGKSPTTTQIVRGLLREKMVLEETAAGDGDIASKPRSSLKGEQVIAVMGSTGVGKSSFIRDPMPPDVAKNVKVGHGLRSETNQVQPFPWVTEDGTRIELVDTPGFDDSREGVTDVQVLKMIATFLTERHGANSRLTGLIYIHRISDTRVGGTSQRNLRMFRKLCGTDSLKNVVIVTTMWDKVTPEEGLRREQELMSSSDLFKILLDGGATMMRHERTAESATKVINRLLGKKATTTQIVHEMMEETKILEETAAGGELRSDIEALLKRHQADMESVRNEMRESARDLVEDRRRTEQNMAKFSKELYELRQGIPMPLPSDPPPDYEFVNNFPAPETTCVVNYSNLLQLFKIHQAILAPAHSEFLGSVASGAAQFAIAVERSVGVVQQGLSTLKLVLTSQSVHSLRQFMKADPHPRVFTSGMWTKARDDMKILTNRTKAILSQYHKSRIPSMLWNTKAKRFDALNTILESMRDVVADMETMMKWWMPIIDALGKIEDATHRMRAGTGFNDNAVKVTLTRIIRALGSYCDAYSRCPEDIRRAVVGLPCN